MTLFRITGLILIGVPIAFNILFFAPDARLNTRTFYVNPPITSLGASPKAALA